VEIHAELRGGNCGGEGRRRGGDNCGGGGRRRGGEGRRKDEGTASCKHLVRPGLGDEGRGDSRAEAAAGRQSGVAGRCERRHAKRVHRSLRMNPGYDEREGESN